LRSSIIIFLVGFRLRQQ